MQSGKLRHKVELQKYYNIKNSIGEVSKLYTTYAFCWAEIKSASSTSYETGQKEQSEETHIFNIRYISTVDQKDRIKFNNDFYEIVEIINFDNRKSYQTIKAKKLC